MIPSTMLKSVVFKFPDKRYKAKRERGFEALVSLWNSVYSRDSIHGPMIYIHASTYRDNGSGEYEVWFAPIDVESETSLCKFIPIAERVARNLWLIRNSILLFKWFVILLVVYTLYKLTLASVILP